MAHFFDTLKGNLVKGQTKNLSFRQAARPFWEERSRKSLYYMHLFGLTSHTYGEHMYRYKLRLD